MCKFTGIDISKQTIDCSILKENGKVVHKKLGNNHKGFEKLLTELSEDSHVVMEASGPYYLKLSTFLFEKGIKVSVVNPLIIRRFCQMRFLRTKTDKKDASMIREYGELENPALWEPDEPMILKLKQLSTCIDLLDKSITASTNQLLAFKEMPGTDEDLIKQMQFIIEMNEKEKEKMEKQMDEISKQYYGKTYECLQSIPGIGPKTSAMLIAITANFSSFEHYKQLIAYVGLNPRVFESGTSVKGKGHICKIGTARLRKTIYLCTWSAKRTNPQCAQMYERLQMKCKPKKVINVAIANKLLRQAFAVGKKLVPFEENLNILVAN